MTDGMAVIWDGICRHCGHGYREISRKLDIITSQLEIIMTEQQNADAIAAQIETDVAQENAALAAIQAEIASLQAAHPAVDFTSLNKAVSDLGAAAAAEAAVVPPAPAPPAGP